MSERQREPREWLESLRNAGDWRLDPARFHYLEALSRRLPDQPEGVRRLLQDRLHAALSDYAARIAQAKVTTANDTVPPPGRAPLAQLNDHIRGASTTGLERAATGETQQPDELASVRRFRRAWSSKQTREQVERAASRKPANAGPLNSHVLVLQSLEMMGELSPDYLRRFVAQVESLQWLERAGAGLPRQPGKPAKGVAGPARAARRGK